MLVRFRFRSIHSRKNAYTFGILLLVCLIFFPASIEVSGKSLNSASQTSIYSEQNVINWSKIPLSVSQKEEYKRQAKHNASQMNLKWKSRKNSLQSIISALERANAWLKRVTKRFSHLNVSNELIAFLFYWLLRILAYIVIAAAIILIVYGLFRLYLTFIRTRPSYAKAESIPETISAKSVAESSEKLLRDAEKMFADGNVREAIRTVYFAGLSVLVNKAITEYDEHRTNRDYARAVARTGNESAYKTFVNLTDVFDPVFYGGKDPVNNDYKSARELVISLGEEL